MHFLQSKSVQTANFWQNIQENKINVAVTTNGRLKLSLESNVKKAAALLFLVFAHSFCLHLSYCAHANQGNGRVVGSEAQRQQGGRG